MDTNQVVNPSKKSQPDTQKNGQQQNIRVESLINFYEQNPIFYNRKIEKEKSVKQKITKSNIWSKVSGKTHKQPEVKFNSEQHTQKQPKQKEIQDKGINNYILFQYIIL